MNNAYIRAQQCKVKEAKFPFVKIGTQYWTTKNLSLAVTPQGNTIPEVQANGNVEKYTTANALGTQDANSITGLSVTAGTLTSVTTENSIVPIGTYMTKLVLSNQIDNLRSGASVPLIAGKWYKFVCNIYTTVATTNFRVVKQVGISNNIVPTQALIANQWNIIITYYQAPDTVTANFLFQITSGSTYTGIYYVDNTSFQEIGWSGSQELYDGIYAQTSGTVEQKTYAAVKAAAMWSNYTNNIPIGLIYGKLYNWFAVKLLQMDIDYFNAANPTKKWANGFRMPTLTEFQTLSTFLGGDAVSGGHLKEDGLAHWISPNTGADNSSGLTLLPSGMRSVNGSPVALYSDFKAWAITETNSTNSKRISIDCGSPASAFLDGDKRLGCSIRLIKA